MIILMVGVGVIVFIIIMWVIIKMRKSKNNDGYIKQNES